MNNTVYIYSVFYNGKSEQLQADNLLDAKNKAIALFRPPKSKRHMVSVMLAGKIENDSENSILHSGAEL